MLVLTCSLVLSSGCKKGCGTCKSYGNNSGGNLAYSTQICVNNFCTCLNGLEGDSCQTYSVNKYIQPTNSWLVYDGCSGIGSQYPVTIYSNPSAPYTSVLISGLFGGGQVQANIASSAGNTSTIYMPAQSTQYGTINSSSLGSYQYNSGLGKITFQVDYTSNSTGIESVCTLTLYQQ